MEEGYFLYDRIEWLYNYNIFIKIYKILLYKTDVFYGLLTRFFLYADLNKDSRCSFN
jgi:hypothetical protein